MSEDVTMRETAKRKARTDWRDVGAMTERERRAAANADPDARPMTEEEWEMAPRVPRVSIVRRALRLSQQEFAAYYRIPVGTLRDWELGRTEPDAAAKDVIASEPEMVRKALARRRRM